MQVIDSAVGELEGAAARQFTSSCDQDPPPVSSRFHMWEPTRDHRELELAPPPMGSLSSQGSSPSLRADAHCLEKSLREERDEWFTGYQEKIRPWEPRENKVVLMASDIFLPIGRKQYSITERSYSVTGGV